MAARVAGARRRDKAGRQRRIVQILRTREVDSQAELARLLSRGGDEVTQATLSRDLEDLGALRSRTAEGRVVYRVPEESPASADWLERMLQEFATDVASSGNVCIVRTPPGGANAVARAIDNAVLRDVLGTIAGDDTIMIVATQQAGGAAVARRLRKLAGMRNVALKGD